METVSSQHLKEGPSTFPGAQESRCCVGACATVGRDKMEPLGWLILPSGENFIGLERRGSGFIPTVKVHIRSPPARRLGAVDGEV